MLFCIQPSGGVNELYCFIVLGTVQKEKRSGLQNWGPQWQLAKILVPLEREETGAGKTRSQVKACRKVGREGVSLLLPALCLTIADLGYAQAQNLHPGKNSSGTRWWGRTTKPEAKKSFRAATGYCKARDLSWDTVVFRYIFRGSNCEWSSLYGFSSNSFLSLVSVCTAVSQFLWQCSISRC